MPEVRRAQNAHVPVIHGEVELAAPAANLLVFTDDPARLRGLHIAKSKLLRHAAERVIVLDATHDPQTTALTPPTSEPEYIEMQIGSLAPQTAVELSRHAVNPELPVSLWWNAVGSAHNPLFIALGEICSRVVVDSGIAEHPSAAVADLDHFRARLPQVIVTDLAWHATRPWRDAVEHFFSRANEHEPWPAIIRTEIRSGNVAQSVYIAAWLARRFGWTAVGTNRFVDAAGNATHVIFEESPNFNAVASLRLRSTTAEFSAYFSSELPSLLCAFGTNGRESHHLRMPFAGIDGDASMTAALSADATDEEFRFTLPIVRDLEATDE